MEPAHLAPAGGRAVPILGVALRFGDERLEPGFLLWGPAGAVARGGLGDGGDDTTGAHDGAGGGEPVGLAQ